LRSAVIASSRPVNKLAETKERQSSFGLSSKSDNRSDLVVINSVDQRGNQNNFDACFVKIVNGAFHIEEIPLPGGDCWHRFRSHQTEVDVAQAGLSRLRQNSYSGELVVCSRLH
jgi:hypothetical protein